MATVRLAETFTISRGSEEAEVVQVEFATAALRLRRGGADRALRRVGRVGARVARAGRPGDDPFALDEIFGWLPPGEDAARAALDAALHDLQGKLLGRPVYQLLGLRRAGPPTSWTIWLGDPGRHGAPHREDPRPRLQAAEAEARRPRRARRRARQRGARRHRPAAAVRRQRGLVARRGARVPAAADDAPVLRAAARRRRSRRAGAEAPLAGPDLRRRGLPHARRRRGAAPSARTGSTSSSRSPAGSARRCAWCTPRARSASA